MALTTERYIPDGGKVTVNSVDQSGSIKTVSPSAPRRSTKKINTLGGSATESQDRDKAGNYEVGLSVLDDRSKGNEVAGILGVLYAAYIGNNSLSALTIVPAGSTPGMSEYSYSSVEVVQCPPHGNMEADTEDEATVDVVLTAASVSSAALS
ncbi:MAG: hypothetical protein DRI46_08370 [Chloroflexi bacterium]|nr:MAG: hypothetical protein DRI46_08370 [Chloroflexota bacterium]